MRLAVITGKPPTEADPRAAACTATPLLKAPIPGGDGVALLKCRPDMRRAVRQLAATARIGVATADLYPKIVVAGSVSGQRASPAPVLKSNGFGFRIGPFVSWSFPNITVACTRIKKAEASTEVALAGLDGVVLASPQETETSLLDYADSLDQNAACAWHAMKRQSGTDHPSARCRTDDDADRGVQGACQRLGSRCRSNSCGCEEVPQPSMMCGTKRAPLPVTRPSSRMPMPAGAPSMIQLPMTARRSSSPASAW